MNAQALQYLQAIVTLGGHGIAAHARVQPEVLDRMRENLTSMAADLLTANAALRAALTVLDAAESVIAGEGPRAN